MLIVMAVRLPEGIAATEAAPPTRDPIAGARWPMPLTCTFADPQRRRRRRKVKVSVPDDPLILAPIDGVNFLKLNNKL